MNIRQRLQRLFKLRFALTYPFVVYAVIFANADDASMRFGIGVILIGLAIRLWANGYAIKMDKLTTSGPYAFVRNPLYLGTLFIAGGFVAMLRMYYAGALMLLCMGVAYYRTIQAEEKMLESKFKDEYLGYKKKVPVIVPLRAPYRGGERWPFSFRRLVESREYKTVAWVWILIIVFYLKDRLLVEGAGIDATIIVSVLAALVLALVDITGEILKKFVFDSKIE